MFDEDEATVMVPAFGAGFFFADRYRIDALLGSGAMGRVYACTELHSERKLALKVLHPERLSEEETLGRFRREAEALASIGHPCIVEIFAFHHTSDGIPYLAMELLEGVTLKTRLTNAGRFEDPRDLQEVVDCVAAALEAAHARGVVHRDLKPDNVFLPATGEPRAKLVDFGLSRLAAQQSLRRPGNNALTHRGMMLGTPRYMAPEQLRDASSAGPAVDIFSLGVLVYESLTGQSPYPAEDYGHLLGCVIEQKVVPFEDARPDLPSALGDVIRHAMNPDPARRVSGAGAFADAFGAAIGSPSRRVHTAPPRARSVSSAPLPMDKGRTLAFDAASVRPPPMHDVADDDDARPTIQTTAPVGAPSAHPPPDLWSAAPASFGPQAPPRAPPRRPHALLFLAALVVVVTLCAVAGYGLRAYVEAGLPTP